LRITPAEYGGVLLNPSSAEVIEWMKQTQPIDTIRVLDDDGSDNVALASGYGWTHSLINNRIRPFVPKKYFGMDLILYRMYSTWLWNPIDNWDGIQSEKVAFDSGLRYVSPRLRDIAKTIISVYDVL